MFCHRNIIMSPPNCKMKMSPLVVYNRTLILPPQGDDKPTHFERKWVLDSYLQIHLKARGRAEQN